MVRRTIDKRRSDDAEWTATKLSSRHLLGIEHMPAQEINALLDAAAAFKSHAAANSAKLNLLAHKTVANFFFEDSTRTRNSFEMAAMRLGADVLTISSTGSSISKGESIDDTARTIAAMGIDVAVVRHSGEGIPARLSTVIHVPIINAGDGAHEHPTQALLDALTLRERLGSIEKMKIWIIGDIAHSRVARSNIYLLKALGAIVTVCGPRTLVPPAFGKAFGVKVSHNISDAFLEADAVIVLRVQLERQAKGLIPSVAEYTRFYGVRVEHLLDTSVKAILHPGPINRGVEIADDVADSELSAITQQVTNGVFVRMAVLHAVVGRQREEAGEQRDEW